MYSLQLESPDVWREVATYLQEIFIVCLVIVTKQMQKPMYKQYPQLCLHRVLSFFSLPSSRVNRNDYVAQYLTERRKTIGRGILVSERMRWTSVTTDQTRLKQALSKDVPHRRLGEKRARP